MNVRSSQTGRMLASEFDIFNEIEAATRQCGTSLMPEGLEKVIDHQAMADLLAFLTQSE